MPKGVKPPATFHGKKGSGCGRKSKAEEAKKTLENYAKKVTDEALIKLVKSRIFKELSKKHISSLMGDKITKDIALPIYLKNQVSKFEGSITTYDDEQRKRIADRIRKRTGGA